jgi:monofunctional biosynthetic peptidoglycan transglycosylase
MLPSRKIRSRSKNKKQGVGLLMLRWIKRIVIGLFLLQLFYIVILKWINPPFTLTQLSSLFGGDGL